MSDASAKAPFERPNVLWICTDQQRYDTIRALGNGRINTPNLDRLVEDGVTLTRAFSQSPVCTPSRAAFLTGRYPRTTGCRQNGQAIPARERLITRTLADVGYTCGLSGKLHLSSCAGGRVEQRIDDGYAEFHWSHHPQPDWPENAYTQWLASRGRSWDELTTGPATPYVKHGIPAEYHQTTWCAERAVEFIRANRDRPWLFSLNCFDPHHPFDPPADYLARYRPEDMPLPKFRPGELANKPDYQKLDHEWAHNEPGYFHVGAMTDDDRRQVTAAYYAMVELIDAQVGRMLGALYDEAARVPLVVSWPGRFRAGLRADALVELVDLAPTLLEAAGLDVPAAMQGRSLLPILTGEADPSSHRDAVYSEYYNAWTHKHSYGTMLRTRHEKIVVYHGIDQGELYDLDEDPDEFDNLWDRPDRAAMKMRLLKQAFDASVHTMDPMPPRLGAF